MPAARAMACRPASSRESLIVGTRRLCDGGVQTFPWGCRTRQVCIWSLTQRANTLTPDLPQVRHARRAVDDVQVGGNPPGGFQM